MSEQIGSEKIECYIIGYEIIEYEMIGCYVCGTFVHEDLIIKKYGKKYCSEECSNS